MSSNSRLLTRHYPSLFAARLIVHGKSIVAAPLTPAALTRPETLPSRLNTDGQGLLNRLEASVAQMCLEEEAEDCRRKALAYLGQPEASILLKVAREFDRLARERDTGFAREQSKGN